MTSIPDISNLRQMDEPTPRTLPAHHAEAYCLMKYVCDGKTEYRLGGSKDEKLEQIKTPRCGYEETIWNSRDGVTPFSISCPKCGGSLLHKGPWRADAFAPYHVPAAGSRIFTDLTLDVARVLARRQAADPRWYTLAKEQGMTPEQIEEIRYVDMVGDGVNPMVRTVKSAEEIYPNRHGIGYAGLRGLKIEFEAV